MVADDSTVYEVSDFYRAMRMHSADYAAARCLSVCLTHADNVSKRLNVIINL